MTAFRLALFISALFAVPSSAATVNLSAAKDTTIFDGGTSVDFSAGGQTKIYVGSNNMSGFPARRGLLEFDLSGIPAGSVITGASLKLTLDTGADASSPTVSLYRVNAQWGEGSVSTGGGNGAAAGVGDATWKSNQNAISTWATPGGDRSGTASAAQTVAGQTAGSQFIWDSLSNPALLSDVQAWYANAANNHGWELINSLEGTGGSVKQFVSKEGATLNRPVLSITYVPEPATLGMIITALQFGLLYRRRASPRLGQFPCVM